MSTGCRQAYLRLDKVMEGGEDEARERGRNDILHGREATEAVKQHAQQPQSEHALLCVSQTSDISLTKSMHAAFALTTNWVGSQASSCGHLCAQYCIVTDHRLQAANLQPKKIIGLLQQTNALQHFSCHTE